MKVYVILKTENRFERSHKRSDASQEVVTVFRNKEKAYEFAHNNLLEYLRDRYHPCDDVEWDSEAVNEYIRDETEPWKVSFRKVQGLLSDVLGQTKFGDLSTHRTFEVVESSLE